MMRHFENGDTSSWLIGDSGYPQEPFLMTPILNALPGSPQERYNNAHCLARNCVERCIGVLKMRFRCINGERELRYNPRTVGSIINTCAVLHNMCLVAEPEEYIGDFNINLDDGDEQIIFQNDNEGVRRRNLLIQNYFV